ncbi:coiled-coil domain-containing protein SCD2 [Daucus carota subsp. sativus]|uniref:coiled-coil domain-containing protein SCD2 n=1 Tax=Daucus carota subsp. sativus TaxID=79200 RepID=UPI0007EFF90E|nr:PREDICTED: coiled-coil domain-containing protein SCD2-like [Daucus carota subsp. sativus]
MTSPMQRHARSASAAVGSASGKKLLHSKAAAQRLANVMAAVDDSDEEDDFVLESAPSIGIGGRGRAARPSSPMAMPARTHTADPQARPSGTWASLPGKKDDLQSLKKNSLAANREHQSFDFAERPSSLAGIRASQRVKDAEEQPPSSHVSVGSRASQKFSADQRQSSVGSRTPKSLNYFEKQASPMANSRIQSSNAEQPHSTRSSFSSRTSQSPRSGDQVHAPLARSGSGIRSPRSVSSLDQHLSAVRPSLRVKAVQMVPHIVPLKLRPSISGIPGESPRREKKLSIDLGSMKLRDPGNQNSASDLQDEVDILQEENEHLLEKLRRAESRFRDSDMRTRALEKQVSCLGEGVSMEKLLLSRKQADLHEREAALKAVEQTFGGKGEEIVLLRMESESAREEATSVMKQLENATKELTSLQIMTKRMILSPEEMEEVVMKRCWLAQQWSLCVRHGVHSDIASARYDYWSSFARRPSEVVLAAGERAKVENFSGKINLHKKGNIEDMLMVERGLRELTLLKVESALVVAMAHKRRQRSSKSGVTDKLKLPIDCQYSTETFDLSKEESDDVRFKQAWLLYFWRRVKNHGLEPEIAEERVKFWISQSTQQATSQEAVNVERGFSELRKLDIEAKLWKESRKIVED